MGHGTCPRCNREMTPGTTCIDTAPRVPWNPAALNESMGLDLDPHRNCRDCNCPPGGLHHAYCCLEECPDCGDQALQCGCIFPVIPVSEQHRRYPAVDLA
jgi:hypothetical protein